MALAPPESGHAKERIAALEQARKRPGVITPRCVAELAGFVMHEGLDIFHCSEDKMLKLVDQRLS